MNTVVAQAWEPLLLSTARQRDIMREASQSHIDSSTVIFPESSWKMAFISATVESLSDAQRPQLSNQVAVVLRLQILQANHPAAHQLYGQLLIDFCLQQPSSSCVFEGMLVNVRTS